MTFDKKITLLLIEPGEDSGEETVTKSRYAWANIRDIGVTVKYSAASAGRLAELQAICHRSEYESGYYTHVDYKGHRYCVESTGAADTPRHIKLILAKEG